MIKNGFLLIAAFAVLLCVVSLEALAGSERTNVRGVGMGRTSVATSRGLDAVGINPANLALPDDGTVTLSIAPMGFQVGSDFLTYDLYTTYFTGEDSDSGRTSRFLNDGDKHRIMDSFHNGKGEISFDAGLRIFGMTFRSSKFGAVAFTVSDQLSGSFTLPAEYLRFILFGNSIGSMYDFSGVEARTEWLREYALSYGGELPNLSLFKWLSGGIGVKYVQGFAYFEVQRYRATLMTAENGILTGSIDFQSRFSGNDPDRPLDFQSLSFFGPPAGSGIGFDLGIAGGLSDAVSFGISLTDLGSVTWKKATTEVVAKGAISLDDPTSIQQQNLLDEAFNGETRKIDPFTTPLPTTLRVGVALELHKVSYLKEFVAESRIAVEYDQRVVNIAGLANQARLSVGIEYNIFRWLPLRTGMSFGGMNTTSLAFGMGLQFGPFDLDLATESISWLINRKEFSTASVSVGGRLRL